VKIDKVTNLLSDESCPESYEAAFLAGTALRRRVTIRLTGGNILQKSLWVGKKRELARAGCLIPRCLVRRGGGTGNEAAGTG